MARGLKNKLGQYFTTCVVLKEKVLEFILNNPQNILEPSIGQGDLVSFITEKIPHVSFDMYEIDTSIPLLDGVHKDKVIYGDFITQKITKKYKTIVGNPPYIRTKKGNLYIDFTEKCYELLDDKGELIFIVPSEFLKLTSASRLLKIMAANGTFTHVFHPHNEKMFDNASIDVIVFRYCKDVSLSNETLYNDKLLYLNERGGIVTFSNSKDTTTTEHIFSDFFDIYVGLVSGRDSIYKNKVLGNIEVINGENKVDKYIYIKQYPCENESTNEYLLQNKKELIERKIRKFNMNNWYEWGAPRNISAMENNIGKECIYIYNLTRKSKVSFIDKVNYFGGGLLVLIPKPSKSCNLKSTIEYINSDEFKGNFMFSGRFKIGHRQLCNSNIPNNCLCLKS